jgi:arginine deiminase
VTRPTGTGPAAFGGEGWSIRQRTLRQEIGDLWSACGLTTEWRPLRSVLLHRPGAELSEDGSTDPNARLLLAPLNLRRAQAQHDDLAQAYRDAGVTVHDVTPAIPPPPNLIFCADLMLMTPEGAVVGRPASPVRAGEERWVARRLADLSIPILRTIRGAGTFEGADAAWLNPHTVLLANGLRTNPEGAAQVAALLSDLGVQTVSTTLPPRTMHLMGQVRFLDDHRALAWPGRLPDDARAALADQGYEIFEPPDGDELRSGMAMNLVTLGPAHVLMPAGNPHTRSFLEDLGVRCDTTPVDELTKAAGAIGCLTGILERD